MNGQNQNGKVISAKSKGRGCLTLLGRIMLSIIGLSIVGYIYEPIVEAAEVKAYPPPGQIVDVGGYSMHINCTGEGSPTVVVESGWGDMSASWSWVQPEVAKKTRVCTYDRAGMGWSESSPQPRSAREYAKELHTLLINANEPGPYVLVGHSMGSPQNSLCRGKFPMPLKSSSLLMVCLQNAGNMVHWPGRAVTPSPQEGSPISI